MGLMYLEADIAVLRTYEARPGIEAPAHGAWTSWPKGRDDTDRLAVIRRCIWALGKIGTEEAVVALWRVLDMGWPRPAFHAEKQLNRRLGARSPFHGEDNEDVP